MKMVITTKERAVGAIVGALIGDALALGCHWYYDFNVFHEDYGDWVSTYVTPKAGRYHSGMKAGQISQSGIILVMLLRSIVAKSEYDEIDFTDRLEKDLFPLLDGTPNFGPGGYTNESIRDAYQHRVKEKKSWQEAGGEADTSEAAEHGIVLGVRYANDLNKLIETVASNCRLTQRDNSIVELTIAYEIILSQLIKGKKLTPELLDELSNLPKIDKPLHEALSWIKEHFHPNRKIEPAWKVAKFYGMSCPIQNQLPAAFYLAAQFSNDFELAVLHAVNGAGENISRAMLTGALVGAEVGIQGIPERFIKGLENATEFLVLANELAELI